MAKLPDNLTVNISLSWEWRSVQFLEQAGQILIGLASKVECMVCGRKLRPDMTHVWEEEPV